MYFLYLCATKFISSKGNMSSFSTQSVRICKFRILRVELARMGHVHSEWTICSALCVPLFPLICFKQGRFFMLFYNSKEIDVVVVCLLCFDMMLSKCLFAN